MTFPRVNESFVDVSTHKDVFATDLTMKNRRLIRGIQGIPAAWSSTVSAVDIALWDIKGKHLGQPVWRLLGGYSARVPAYITFGLLEYNREQIVEAAKQFTAKAKYDPTNLFHLNQNIQPS